MLPLKIDLTDEKRAILKSTRTHSLINGKYLTAEQLSHSIGKNRAWMSQIESGRLKTIRREDIISIYKFLLDIDEAEAEKIAEKDFSYKPKNNAKLEVILDDDYEGHEEDEQRFNTIVTLKRILGLFYQDCIKIFNNSNDEEKKKLLLSLQELEFNIKRNNKDTLHLMSVPLSLLSNIDYNDKKDILDDIDKLTVKCNRYLGQKNLKQYYESKEYFLLLSKQLENMSFVENNEISELGLRLSMTFINLSFVFANTNFDNIKNIELMNDFLYLLYMYQSFIPDNLKYYIDFLKPTANKEDIKNKVDEIQNYICNVSNTPIIIHGNVANNIEKHSKF